MPADPADGLGRVLTEDGTFVDKRVNNKPPSSNRSSVDRSSLLLEQPPQVTEREIDEFDDENDEMLKQTKSIIRAVMEMSNKVPISRPPDYVDLVKVWRQWVWL